MKSAQQSAKRYFLIDHWLFKTTQNIQKQKKDFMHLVEPTQKEISSLPLLLERSVSVSFQQET